MGVVSHWLWCCMCRDQVIPKSKCTIPVTITLMLQHFLKFSSMCKGLHHLLGQPNIFPTCLLPVFPIPPRFPPSPPPPFFLFPNFLVGIRAVT